MKEKSRLRRFFRRYGADYAFVAPYTILFTVFSIVPVVMSMGLSLTYFNVLETPVFNGISNYLRLFLDDKLFLTAVKTPCSFRLSRDRSVFCCPICSPG